MRSVVIESEVTAESPDAGGKLIEIACLELQRVSLTGRAFHSYFNPGQPQNPTAVEIHGISDNFLALQPRFADLAESLVDFLKGTTLVGHNISFELSFLDAELAAAGFAGLDELEPAGIVDTLMLARGMLSDQSLSPEGIIEYYQPGVGVPGIGSIAMAHRVAKAYGLLQAG